ncbi:LytTR family DNA-binding domain-containing protein [Mucilaginibacter daejeonensis]|uniref:LytR/AlgR family response regulator transcription factor n=1 Tax=Mucilaginibacter daejeonensis TaxID=398049 RepID=UPI001D178A0F|nr:LytTR family DNA-binding domain-containing protein [Mucilaginibacter daejeonensis]UEG52117.1 LytTR family DNA-binding domain-containing protein [Mucilaginibacter daejeonensis]
MTLRCIAIDDEPLALELIKVYAARFPSLQLLQVFEDALSGAEFLRQHHVDLLFIDINMPDISGLDLVRSLKNRPIIIFTTAYKNFAFEGFELEALDYLLKPIDQSRFSKAVDRALAYHQYRTSIANMEAEQSIYVYSEYRMIKIDVQEIIYIESMEDYIKIHLTTQTKPVLTLMPLKKILAKLPQEQFKRIHRSFIVGLRHIHSIQNRKIRVGTVELPVSDTYIDVLSHWKNKLN